MTTKEYTALRVFILKVINQSVDSLDEAEVLAAREALKGFLSEESMNTTTNGITDPKAIAEKLVGKDGELWDKTVSEGIALVETALRDYGEVVKRNCVEGSPASYIAQGFAEAIEKAAKVVEPKKILREDDREIPVGLGLASEIRALVPKKGK